ncbi:MAG: hypothetical protein PVJ66_04860 [Gammaproteobacteria bacterium]
MKRSTKAALLSGLVFPGIGHIYLKLYVHGSILFVGAASAIYYIISVVVTTAFEVAEKVQSGGAPLDMGAISDLVSQRLSGVEQPTNVALIALVVIWITGVADACRQGRAHEKVVKGSGEEET